MATLMRQISGGKDRRCTAACYQASGNKCRCCCGGANHGKGFMGALQETGAAALKASGRRRGRSGSMMFVLQGDMFAN